MAQPQPILNGDFETIVNVPVFNEGQNEIPHSMEDLAKINNAKVARGEPPVLIIGHTNKGPREVPVIGFLDTFKAGVRNGVQTLFASMKVFKEFASEVKRYPYRSPEIWVDDGHISAVACLGGNAPKLELGMVFQREGKKKFFSKGINTDMDNAPINAPAENDQNSALKALFDQWLAATDIAGFVKSEMANKQLAAAQMPTPEVEQPVAMDKEEAAPEAAPNNPVVPGVEDDKKDESTDVGEDVGEESSDDDEEEDKKKDFAKLRADYRTLLKKFRKSEREKTLLALQSEGYAFDVADELNEDFSDKQFEKHVGRIRKYYSKVTGNRNIPVPTLKVASALTPADMDRVQEYAKQNGKSYEDARKILFS